VKTRLDIKVPNLTGVIPMNMHARFTSSEAISMGATAPAPSSLLRSLCTRLGAWTRKWADRWAAAAAYEDLSRLSDTQLKHRGLSRDVLARDLNG
jgi:hypothetical protein